MHYLVALLHFLLANETLDSGVKRAEVYAAFLLPHTGITATANSGNSSTNGNSGVSTNIYSILAATASASTSALTPSPGFGSPVGGSAGGGAQRACWEGVYLGDQVAFAATYLDPPALRAFLLGALQYCLQQGLLSGLLLSGLRSPLALRLLMRCRTQDVVSVSLLALHPLLHPLGHPLGISAGALAQGVPQGGGVLGAVLGGGVSGSSGIANSNKLTPQQQQQQQQVLLQQQVLRAGRGLGAVLYLHLREVLNGVQLYVPRARLDLNLARYLQRRVHDEEGFGDEDPSQPPSAQDVSGRHPNPHYKHYDWCQCHCEYMFILWSCL